MQAKTLIFLLAGIFSIQAQMSQPSNMQQSSNSCTTIPGIGSPVLMIANAKQYIEDALNIKNQYTVVKFIYYALVPPSANTSTTIIQPVPQNQTAGQNQIPGQTQLPGQAQVQPVNIATTYRLVFSITDYYGTKYAAVEFSVSPFGIGSVKINRFMLTNQLARIKSMIDPNITDSASLSCGDLKYVYSSFGQGNDKTLDYIYPGENNNSAGLNILNNFIGNNRPVSGASANATRTCTTSNFIETSGFFGTATTGATAVDLINCLPSKPAVSAILVGCNANVLSSLQLQYNNYNDNGTTLSAFSGNPNTPASAINTISLGNASRISITTFTTPATVRIQTFDANNAQLTNYTCGTGTTAPQNVVISANDFLGLSSIAASATGVSSFEVTQYRAQ